ncbi:MAG: methyltransferase regulatory domain-containing protein [Labilithrix sp.]|nr:methyltransferase regulatory domain-containing protein [Labilithrix sp.]MCW5813224.1 methyltransferase regulatory domain-containing protein [Labilithrix sp.]
MSAGYVSDVAYVRHFIDELAPARLRLAAATGGVTPPPADDFDYCELGCAHADTLSALAAAHPRARFLGIDIGREHVASAKKLARDGALDNVGFLEQDFGALLEEDVGEFDYIAAYGVLSWISPDKRAQLRAFAQAKLKPGGLLFVTYNAMPGWAAVEPLRQLLLSPLGGKADDPTMERARRGLEFAREMANAGAEYFTMNPAARHMLDTMSKVGLPYVIHEYLHDHWAPMYFARVAWEMSESDLHFAGVLPLHLDFRDTAVPESCERAFAATDRITFESLKDFALNEFFRRDVYVKGRAPRSPSAFEDLLDATHWGTIVSALPATREIALPFRTVKLGAPIFEPLFAALAEGGATLEHLRTSRPELAGYPPDQLRAALQRLLLAELVVPLSGPTRAPAPDTEDRFVVPSPYNQMMLRRLTSEQPLVLASEVAGTGFRSSALEGLALRALTETRGPERAGWVSDFVERHELRLAIDGRLVAERPEQKQVIAKAIETLCAGRLAKLVELGITRPAP